MIHITRCRVTGRFWVNILSGWFAIGFGPRRFVERIHWRKSLVWFK